MNFLNKLLNNQKVEWTTLGEVCEIKNGFAFKSNLFKEKGSPIVRITNIDGRNINLSDTKYFDINDYKKNTLENYIIKKGDILIAMSGATTGKIGYYNSENISYLNQRVGKFIPNKKVLNNRFLYHILLTKTHFLYHLAGGGAQPNLSTDKIKNNIVIPLPPLQVQHEIVRILDKFTSLEKALEKELTLRQKQYRYYRDKLLNFDDNYNVKWTTLGEVCEMYGGLSGKSKDDFGKGNAFFIPYKNIFDHYEIDPTKLELVNINENEKQHKVEYGDILFTGSSETADEVAFSSAVTTHFDKDVYLNSFSFGIRFKKDVTLIPQFAKHLFRSIHLRKQITKTANGVTRFNVSKARFKNIKIPLPPLSEQERIVGILDKFDKLVNSISEGLPREIELRRKQYEYYRNELLNFEQ